MNDEELEEFQEARANQEEKMKLTDWKNEPSFDDLNNDRIESGTFQETIRTKLKKWEEDRNGGKKITPSRPGKSTARPKLIRKLDEWRYPSLEEPFLSTSDMYLVNPVTEEDVDAARQNQLLLNYQWSTKVNKTKLVGDIIRTIVDEGTVIVKTGWYSEEGIKTVEEEQPVYADAEQSLMMMQEMVLSGQMDPAEMQAMIDTGQPMQIGTEKVYVEKEVLVKNHPTYEVCNNANTIIDPTCEGLIENAQFVIHEYSTSMAALKKQAYKKVVEIDEETGIETIYETGIYKNLNLINVDDLDQAENEYDSVSSQNFKYNDKARKKIRAFEYWGYWDIDGTGEVEPIVATWIGKTIIRMERNPFPHKRLPFSIATYMPIKKEVMGEPDAELLAENQESIGKMTRAAHDITSNNAVGQEFIDASLLPPIQRDNYNKGNTVFTTPGMDPRRAIYKNTVSEIPSAVFQMINSQNAEAEALTGIKSFSSGISGQAFGSVATGVRSAMDAVAKRDLSILRRISDLLFKDMARMTIAMNQAYLDEEEVIRVTNSKFVNVRRDDLGGDFDLRIEVSTPEKDNETAQDLGMILQTNAASMDPKLANMVMAKIMTLKKQPDLAEYFENFEPTPDPITQQIKQLELENVILRNEKLKKDIEEGDSKIHERISRVLENETDVQNKQSQRELRDAQRRKLEAEADMLDQAYIDKQSGAARVKELEDKAIEARMKENERNHKAEIEMSKAELIAKIKLLEQQLGSQASVQAN